jgi:hypothetical protein
MRVGSQAMEGLVLIWGTGRGNHSWHLSYLPLALVSRIDVALSPTRK